MQDSERTGGAETAHDRRLHEKEEHSPEGAPPPKRIARLELRIAIPLLLVALIAASVAVWFFGGWGAVIVLLVLVAGWYLLGWGPELLAGEMRREEHERFEREVASEERRED
jgi:membrane protein YdbS with pleckstrin-like domain